MDTSSISELQSGHISVLLHEAVEALTLSDEGRFVDATYGRGGHSQYLLSQLAQEGSLLAIDRDPEAVADATARFADEPRFTMCKANFAELEMVLSEQGWFGEVDGVLLDLGVSSPQLDVAERGFGFSRDGDLDMRMDPQNGQSAAQWLSQVEAQELAVVLKEYGDERYAKRIAAAIVSARDEMPITRTLQLAEIIKVAHPRWERHHHPATRSFQAIRIQVNGELDAISTVLAACAKVLKIGGRVAVISFHSLEDRIAKRTFRQPIPDPRIPRHLPQPASMAHPWRVVGKPIKAGSAELDSNPRARSAVLRVAERVL